MTRTKGRFAVKKIIWRLAQVIAFACAAAMLCILPLRFRDAFFDINRCKADFVIKVMPWFFGAFIIVCLPVLRRAVKGWQPVAAPCIAFALFLALCTASCARLGFPEHLLTGCEGRYGGLWFLLACGAAFACIAAGALRGQTIVVLIMLTSVLCSALGIANALGFDPLGFYKRIMPGQEIMFMSTIGHFDCFGTYIVMMMGICGGQFVFSNNAVYRMFAFLCALLCATAAIAARTDCALLGMHMICAALLAVSGGRHGAIRRAFLLWAAAFAVQPVMLHALMHSRFALDLSGPTLLLGQWPISGIGCVIMLIAACLCGIHRRLDRPAPGRSCTMIAVGICSLTACLALLLIMAYFTIINPTADIGSAANFLRLNENWGSLRGYVYKWSIRAYSDFSLAEKLLGRGLDTTLIILGPYFDDPVGLAGGVFDDAHCQLLQYLLTGGLLTVIAFAAFYIAITYTVGKRAGKDPLLCGIFAALVCYGMILLLNVAQPILLAIYFSISALAVSRIRYLSNKRGGKRP